MIGKIAKWKTQDKVAKKNLYSLTLRHTMVNKTNNKSNYSFIKCVTPLILFVKIHVIKKFGIISGCFIISIRHIHTHTI